MPRLPSDETLEAMRGRRDELQVSLNMLEQAQSSEDAFELPNGPEAEIDDLRSALIAMEQAIAERKKAGRAKAPGL